MIISEEQVRLALEYLQSEQSGDERATLGESDVSPELVERVRDALADIPDTRADRVESARVALEGDGIASSDVAAKLIGRVISDSIR